MASEADVQFLRTNGIPASVERLLKSVVASASTKEDAHEVMNWTPTLRQGVAAPVAALENVSSDALKSLQFDIFSYDANGMAGLQIVKQIFVENGILQEFKIADEVFDQWLATVQLNYHPANPFHNFRHAANVLQTLHVLLQGCKEDGIFSSLEVFSMLVAALCHDLQHPGVNNAFLSDTLHPLAVRYNDHAVLEQHHCATCFGILDLPNHDITASLRGDDFQSNAKFRDFRKDVVACIMGTEVASHKSHTNSLKKIADDGFDKKKSRHRRALMVALVEAADISNETRDFAFSRQWAPLVAEEFFQQGDREAKMGMEVKPMMNREVATLPKEQSGFIDFLCVPLYEALVSVIPSVEPSLKNLRTNKEAWGNVESPSS